MAAGDRCKREKAGRAPRVIAGSLLGVALVLVMATAVVEDFAHEWLGVSTFGLMAWHLWLNRRWWGSLKRGRCSPRRIVSTALDLALVALLVVMVVSALVLSRYAFSWLPAIPGASMARQFHLVCSQWIFVLAFAHCGLHIPRALDRRLRELPFPGKAIAALAGAAIAACAIWSLVDTQLVASMLGQVRFAFVPEGKPLALGILQYASIAALVSGVVHAVASASSARRV